MTDRKYPGLSLAAIMLAALLLTIGTGVAVAQVVASATGSGQIHVSGAYRTFTFSAQTNSNNVTTGLRRPYYNCGVPGVLGNSPDKTIRG